MTDKPLFPMWTKCPTCGLPMVLRSDGLCRNPTCPTQEKKP